VVRLIGGQKRGDDRWLGEDNRCAGERERQAVQIDQDGQYHTPIFGEAVGHQDAIHHLLTGLGVDVEQTTVARREAVVVVRFEGDR